MTHDTRNIIPAPATTTPAEAVTTARNIAVETGLTGRPPRGRYSKAYMMADIISLLDPRLWPIYVAGALIVAILVFAAVQSMSLVTPKFLDASVDATVNPAWVTPEEAMAMAKPRVEPPQATAGTKGNGRVAMFAARNELAVAAANGPATTTPTNTQE